MKNCSRRHFQLPFQLAVRQLNNRTKIIPKAPITTAAYNIFPNFERAKGAPFLSFFLTKHICTTGCRLSGRVLIKGAHLCKKKKQIKQTNKKNKNKKSKEIKNDISGEIICQQTILMKYHVLFVIFEKEAKFEIIVCFKL